MDQKSVETTWAQRGFSCVLWTDAPGQRWENFVHSVDEVVMVVDGNVEFEIGGKTHRPEVGEELFIPAGTLHCASNALRTITLIFLG